MHSHHEDLVLSAVFFEFPFGKCKRFPVRLRRVTVFGLGLDDDECLTSYMQDKDAKKKKNKNISEVIFTGMEMTTTRL